jgi:hypothetical protein
MPTQQLSLKLGKDTIHAKPRLEKRGTPMLIGNKYKLESDELNITLLKREKSKKSGLTYWVAIAWFTTIKNALTYLVDLEVAGTGLTDLATVVKKQDELYRLIGLAVATTPQGLGKGANQ